MDAGINRTIAVGIGLLLGLAACKQKEPTSAEDCAEMAAGEARDQCWQTFAFPLILAEPERAERVLTEQVSDSTVRDGIWLQASEHGSRGASGGYCSRIEDQATRAQCPTNCRPWAVPSERQDEVSERLAVTVVSVEVDPPGVTEHVSAVVEGGAWFTDTAPGHSEALRGSRLETFCYQFFCCERSCLRGQATVSFTLEDSQVQDPTIAGDVWGGWLKCYAREARSRWQFPDGINAEVTVTLGLER